MNPTLLLKTNHGYVNICEIDPRDFPLEAIKIIAQVLKDNKHKYEPGHWRTVAIEDHKAHAGSHLACSRCQLQDEPHLPHALTRLAMAAELEATNKKAAQADGQ